MSGRRQDRLPSTLECVDAGVVAVIPTFRPGAETLELIKTLRPMVGMLIVADDASPCTSDRVLAEISSLENVRIVRFAHNAGIARSLNAGLAIARQHHADWLLTVDQDSMVGPGYVSNLIQGAQLATSAGLGVGVIAPETIADRGGPLTYPIDVHQGCHTTAEVFQSGALWSVSALSAAGGFDESLGMDAVDAEACLALRENGFMVVLAQGLTLAHTWGNSRHVRILGRTVVATGHSPARRASMVRNRLRLAPREFRESPRQAWRSVRRVAVNTVLATTIEDQRVQNFKASMVALVGLRNHNANPNR